MGLPLAIGVAGLALSAIGMLNGQEASEKAAKAVREEAARRAKIAEGQAKTVTAVGQREAADERLKAELMASRAIAVAGASGGDVSSPGVTNLIADISGRGAYNAQTALYNSEESARQLREGATASIISGNTQASGIRDQANAQLLSGLGNMAITGASMYDRYGSRERTT